MGLVVPCQQHGKGETAGEWRGAEEEGQRGSLGCGPMALSSSAPLRRQGAGICYQQSA